MTKLRHGPSNPFGLTKAVDLNDRQILSLWVDVGAKVEDFDEFTRPSSPMPTFILGGKGSGKTHLMRYHSFELQKLRYRDQEISLVSGVERDRYIGIYVRCGGLNSGRFKDKRQSAEVWALVFAYYIELWLVQHLLEIARELDIGVADGLEPEICHKVLGLFDRHLDQSIQTWGDLILFMELLQKQIDFEVNNCALKGSLDIEILLTRGKLLFGVPKLLSQYCVEISETLFVYAIDEFENLTLEQQKFINTLVREKELPSTLRIGSRLYGVKTHATDSDDEENLKSSEFEVLPLDRLFRLHKKRYGTFAKSLLDKRLSEAYGFFEDGKTSDRVDFNWSEYFDSIDDSWESKHYLKLVKGSPSIHRKHMLKLLSNLTVFGIDDLKATKIVGLLSCESYPLLEKAGILSLYQQMFDNRDVERVAVDINEGYDRYISGDHIRNRISSIMEHYKSDLVAQIHRENDGDQHYLGLNNFISMSAGLPRSLLTILRSVFEWSLFNGEDPLRTGRISVEAQYRGVRDASDWFYENMRKAGEDGIAIQTAIDRLARLFRVSRFSDRPLECSLITFSVAEQDVESEAGRILKLAENRSFLNRITGGQKDKNNERVTMKFQLNNMLSPRWELPLGRRGTIPLSPRAFNSIFDPRKTEDFDVLISDWRKRTTAPFFGKLKQKPSVIEDQKGLF